jgi:hypothetical protein
MRNYKISAKQAPSQAFVLKKINLQNFSSAIGSPPIAQRPAPRTLSNYKTALGAVLIIALLALLYALNKPRLDNYNDCYMQNMEWNLFY